MTSKHHTEQEIKLTAANESTLDQLINSEHINQVAHRPDHDYAPRRFAATYYDTPDWSLRELRWSLRTRFEGNTHKSTLKRNSTLKDGFSSCEEIEQPVTTGFKQVACVPKGKISEALLAIMPASTPLLPRIGVTMQRRMRVLEIGGTLLELVTDSGVISANGQHHELHEVELELLQGNMFNTKVSTFTRHLMSTFSLQPSHVSKHQIGLSLYDYPE